LYEAPSFNLPTVNIGDRQARRLRARSVLDSKPTQMDITVAIKKALALECKDVVNPYGTGQAAVKIVDAFARIKAPQFLSRKSFHDYRKS
jgi:UDP-N-acetylglucosamine 2-epimerase